MKVVIKHMLMLFLGLAALSIASPVVARPNHRADPMDAARAAAIQACNARARPYIQTTYGNLEIDIYRACMADKGQME